MRQSHPEPPEQPAPAPRPLPGNDDEKTPVYLPPRPAEVVTFPPKPKPVRPTPDDEVTIPGTPPLRRTEPAAPAAPAQEVHPAEPLVEGFFVARIAGEGELVRHHLTEGTERQPGESVVPADPNEPDLPLPAEYGNDSLVLMARDPHTLFALWDFSPETRRRALGGLGRARVVMRLYEDGDRLLGAIDVALESRSHYLHGLPSGRLYRVELHFVNEQGHSRRIGLSSNGVVLPRTGPSPDTSVRLLRMPRVTPARASLRDVAATAHLRTEPVEERAYITWRRVGLPGSPAGPLHAEGPGSREAPEAPGEAAPAREYLHVPRAEASSERGGGWSVPGAPPAPGGTAEGGTDTSVSWRASHGPAGASEQWAVPPSASGPGPWWLMPSGASESWAGQQAPPGVPTPWMGSHGPAGASEQSGRAPGASAEAEEGPWWHAPSGSSESWAGRQSPPGASSPWRESHGPAGASEQRAGARAVTPPVERWMWTYGPAEMPGPWMSAHGPAGSSEQGAGAGGPARSSEQWTWSHGPAGSSGQGRSGGS